VAVVCLRAAPCMQIQLLMRATDGQTMCCGTGTVNSYQSATTSEIVKRCWSPGVLAALQLILGLSIYIYLFNKGVGAGSTLGEDVFARKYMYEKLTKCPNFS